MRHGLYCRMCGDMIKYAPCENCENGDEAKQYFAAPVQNITNNYLDKLADDTDFDAPIIKVDPPTLSDRFFKFSLACLSVGAGLTVLSIGAICVLAFFVMLKGAFR